MSPGLQRGPSIPPIGKDKYYHFLFGIASVIILYFFLGLGWAILLSSAGWLIKELVYDGLLGYGTVDAWDFVASMVGILVGVIIIISRMIYINHKKKQEGDKS